MTLRIAINGFGRIGRMILRALYESNYRQQVQIVAINDLSPIELSAHLLQFDSVHGAFKPSVAVDNQSLIVNNDRIAYHQVRDPAELPWSAEQVDVVFECTGRFTTREQAMAHIHAGAKKVVLSAPGKDVDATVVFGVNDQVLRAHDQIISNASCTTNCLAPVAQVLHEAFGIERGMMTTIHAYTNDQSLCDGLHADPYRARAAALSMIPTKTGAAQAVGLVLPELAGKLTGMAVRVPTSNVSLVDLTVQLSRTVTAEEVNQRMLAAAEQSPVLRCNPLPLVSCDFNGNPHSSIFDINHTIANGDLLKVMAWYDNEWAFANRMFDTCLALVNAPAA